MELKEYIKSINTKIYNYFKGENPSIVIVGNDRYIKELGNNLYDTKIEDIITVNDDDIKNENFDVSILESKLKKYKDIPIILCCKNTDKLNEILKNNNCYHYYIIGILNNLEKIEKNINRLEDNKSKEVYLCLINYYISLNYNCFKDIYDNNRQYFSEEFKMELSNSTFIDGGAFDGSDSIDFINYANNKIKDIYIFEPDNINFINTKVNIEKKINGSMPNIKLFNIALAEKEGECCFDNSNGSDASVCDDSEYKVKINSIDNVVDGKEVEFIKLDIEGYELNALIGARETIKKNNPIITVCIYHKVEDLWEILNCIEELCPNYKYYVRHHNKVCRYETVLYCIPKGNYNL